mmetsp:Transcript_32569/g.71466  ORF Transcript_32569/g.71466 Transcript_32569/m.71466 type:complete len:394 (+) Transcript_32569:66-1247(+)
MMTSTAKLLLLVAPAVFAAVIRIETFSTTQANCGGDPTTSEDYATRECITVDIEGQPEQDFSYDVRCREDEIEARIYPAGNTDCNDQTVRTSKSVETDVCINEEYFCGNATICNSNVLVQRKFTCFSDEPCFARESSYACRVNEPTVAVGDAFASCFANGPSIKAQRVLMSSLRAGDLVLSQSAAEPSISRVIVNQHVESDHTSVLMHMKHSKGSLSVTADHVVLVDGEFMPARVVKAGSKLALADGGHVEVEHVARSRGGIINPITSDGKILAAGPTGLPVVAATGNEWLADVMLSGCAKYSLSFNLAALFPATVQAYYDAWLEAGFNAAVPTLAALKAAAPAPVVVAGVVAGDLVLAIGLLTFYASSFKVLAALAALGFLAQRYLFKAKKA